MTAPVRVTHLLVADDALEPGRWGAHITLCGELVREPGTPADPDDPYCPDFRFCTGCTAQAVQWQADQHAMNGVAR